MISILPASIFEKSRISLISDSSVLLALSIFAAYSLIFPSLHSRNTISFIPMIALMGVRISWDMFARKSLFAWFACSARVFAARSSSLSLTFSSVLSRYTIPTANISINNPNTHSTNAVIVEIPSAAAVSGTVPVRYIPSWPTSDINRKCPPSSS